MISISGLSKRFGEQRVLRDVSTSIARGRVTAVLGPNGTGKTTLIKSMLGLTRADAGSVLLNGSPVTDDPAYRAGIGYMPQIARFPDNLCTRDLISMLVDLRGQAADVDLSLVTAFNLDRDLGKPLRTLSGGTRQKVNAVLAFLFRPQLLILDEPTAGLDPIASALLKDRILEERALGRTFIITSHVLTELEELADDVVFLLDGRVCFSGALSDLKVSTRQFTLERAIAHLMRQEAA